MLKRNYLLFWLTVTLTIILTKPCFATLTFSLNHDIGAQTVAAEALERFGKIVEEKSGGDMKVNIFHRGELGAEREMFNYLKTGAVEMGLSGSVVIATLAPMYGALDMPYLFSSQAHLRRVISGSIGDGLRKKIQEAGIRVIGSMDRIPRHLMTKGKIVRKPDDLKGIKIRVREIPVQVDAWRALGASPVPMNPSEIYMALQSGTIDAYENTLDSGYSISIWEVQKILILTGHVREVQWLMASEKFWGKLDDRQKKIITDAAQECMVYGDKLSAVQDADYIKKVKDKGMKIIELTDDEKGAFRDRIKDVPKKFEKIWLPGLYEAILKAGK